MDIQEAVRLEHFTTQRFAQSVRSRLAVGFHFDGSKVGHGISRCAPLKTQHNFRHC